MSSSRWPWFVLAVLTLVNLLNYIDRYIFSALLPAIQNDLRLTDTELGLLGSGFVLAYVLMAPLFGHLGDRGHRAHWMSFGVALWSLATAVSGLAMNFTGQLMARIGVGAGEASYSVIAPTSIVESFSRSTRGTALAVYSAAIPIGTAIGFILGGWLEPRVGWQKAFFIVGVPGLFCALLILLMPRVRASREESRPADAIGSTNLSSLRSTYKQLLSHGGFLSTVLGYSAYTFVVGGLVFWMPSYITRSFSAPLERANFIFGGVTIVGGIVGTLVGGWWADRIDIKFGNGYLKVSLVSALFSAPIFWLLLKMPDLKSFAFMLLGLELILFLCISPLDAAIITYVRPASRATAMAFNIVLIHVLGDGISRVWIGMKSDASDLQAALQYLPWGLLIAGGFWSLGVVAFWSPMRWPQGALRIPKRQSHRGYRVLEGVVENTLTAFREAMNHGAEMFECDVRLCRDGVPVVFHDRDLMRVAQRPDRVVDLTSDEIAKAAGAPTLREVLTDSSLPSRVNIEIKNGDCRPGDLEKAVARVVRDAGAEGRVMVSSFSPMILRRISFLLPEVPRAYLLAERNYHVMKLFGAWARPHLVHLEHTLATKSRVERWAGRGIPVAVWTVNEAVRIEELEGMGVVSIISDLDITSLTQDPNLERSRSVQSF